MTYDLETRNEGQKIKVVVARCGFFYSIAYEILIPPYNIRFSLKSIFTALEVNKGQNDVISITANSKNHPIETGVFSIPYYVF